MPLLRSRGLQHLCDRAHTGPIACTPPDGDSSSCIQEAIDTCPVDCIHWVDFEELEGLRVRLEGMELLPLGLPSPARPRRQLPRSRP